MASLELRISGLVRRLRTIYDRAGRSRTGRAEAHSEPRAVDVAAVANSASVLITGASSGLGAAFAQVLADRGRALVLVARDEDRLRALAKQLPVTVEVLVADLTEASDLARVEARLRDPLRPIDLLVNNAGSATRGDVIDQSLDGLTNEVNLNVLAVVRLTRAVLPGLIERGSGGVLNVSSAASRSVLPELACYAASKAFVDSWSKSIAKRLIGTGVTISYTRPSYTRTEFHRRAGFEPTFMSEAEWLDPRQVAVQALAAFDAGQLEATTLPNRRSKAPPSLRQHTARAWRLVTKIIG